jgi:hypothetical protein
MQIIFQNYTIFFGQTENIFGRIKHKKLWKIFFTETNGALGIFTDELHLCGEVVVVPLIQKNTRSDRWWEGYQFLTQPANLIRTRHKVKRVRVIKWLTLWTCLIKVSLSGQLIWPVSCVTSHIAWEWGCAYMYKCIIYDITRFKAVMTMNLSELRN